MLNFSTTKNTTHSLPLWSNVWKKAFFILDGFPEYSCWGQGIPWTKRESDGLGLIIPTTEGRDDLVMYCSKSLAHYGGRFERRKKGGGYICFEHFKSGRRDPISLWWELLHNMSGMQSFKVLLLFFKEQCRFLLPLHHNRSCVLIPFPEQRLHRMPFFPGL